MKLWLIKQAINVLTDNKDIASLLYKNYFESIVFDRLFLKMLLNKRMTNATFLLNLRMNEICSSNTNSRHICCLCTKGIWFYEDYLSDLSIKYYDNQQGSLCYRCIYSFIN